MSGTVQSHLFVKPSLKTCWDIIVPALELKVRNLSSRCVESFAKHGIVITISYPAKTCTKRMHSVIWEICCRKGDRESRKYNCNGKSYSNALVEQRSSYTLNMTSLFLSHMVFSSNWSTLKRKSITLIFGFSRKVSNQAFTLMNSFSLVSQVRSPGNINFWVYKLPRD